MKPNSYLLENMKNIRTDKNFKNNPELKFKYQNEKIKLKK